MPKLKINRRRIKHKITSNDLDYVLKIGSSEFNFGQYSTDYWQVFEDYEIFSIKREKGFKTKLGCQKYMLECIAKWINKNVDLSYSRVGLHEMIVRI